MSYEPTNWKTGDVVTSAKLNKIEGGVSEVSEAYEPTVWKTGDVVTSAKLNKIEQALADDSGSSDFSTAEVTFINGSSQDTVYRVQATEIVDNTVLYSGYLTVSNEEPVTLTVPLYKGSYQLSVGCFKQDTVDQSVPPTATGEISLQLLDGGPVFMITGDGTITATGKEGR